MANRNALIRAQRQLERIAELPGSEVTHAEFEALRKGKHKPSSAMSSTHAQLIFLPDAQTEQSERATHSEPQPEPKPEPKRKSEAIYVKVYASMAAWALQKRHVNAFALWTLARAFDTLGQGRMVLAELRKKCEPYLRGDRFRRALRDAEKCGMLRRVRRHKDNAHIVELRSNLQAARAMGLDTLGARPVLVNAIHVRKIADFKARLLSAWHKGKSARNSETLGLIARKSIQKVTGVSPSGQRTYEKRAHVRVDKNIAVVHVPAKDLDAVLKGVKWPYRKDAFPINAQTDDNHTGEHRAVIGYRLPNKYSNRLRKAKRGNIGKVNSALWAGLIPRREQDPGQQKARQRGRFHTTSFKTKEQAIAVLKGEDKRKSEGGSGMVGEGPENHYFATKRRTIVGDIVFNVLEDTWNI